MRGPMPWEGVVPEEDIAACARAFTRDASEVRAGRSPALVIIDMTREFVDSAYPLGHSATGDPAVAATRRLLDAAREAAIPVFFTKAFPDVPHVATPAEMGRWRTTVPYGTLRELPPGDVVVDALAPRPGETVICKGTKPSAFFGTTLLSQLQFHQVDTVLLSGMTTSGCVRATAVDGFQHNLHVVIPHETVADRSQLSHAVNLFDIDTKYGHVTTLDEALAYVSGLRPTRASA